jgi:U6 snRNA-associated Sm-like protein LSm1
MAETELATRSGATPSASDQDYLPGAASMIEEVDKKVMIVLRDGRHLTGKLRSFDQFMNLILEDTYERVFLTGKFSDVPLGLYIVRGDTIVLMGEVDADPEVEAANMGLEKVSPDEIDEEGLIDSKIAWDFE